MDDGNTLNTLGLLTMHCAFYAELLSFSLFTPFLPSKFMSRLMRRGQVGLLGLGSRVYLSRLDVIKYNVKVLPPEVQIALGVACSGSAGGIAVVITACVSVSMIFLVSIFYIIFFVCLCDYDM